MVTTTILTLLGGYATFLFAYAAVKAFVEGPKGIRKGRRAGRGLRHFWRGKDTPS